MKVLEYLTKEPTGCCNVAELMALSKDDKANGTHHVETLKQWAREEAANKGITIDS